MRVLGYACMVLAMTAVIVIFVGPLKGHEVTIEVFSAAHVVSNIAIAAYLADLARSRREHQ